MPKPTKKVKKQPKPTPEEKEPMPVTCEEAGCEGYKPTGESSSTLKTVQLHTSGPITLSESSESEESGGEEDGKDVEEERSDDEEDRVAPSEGSRPYSPSDPAMYQQENLDVAAIMNIIESTKEDVQEILKNSRRLPHGSEHITKLFGTFEQQLKERLSTLASKHAAQEYFNDLTLRLKNNHQEHGILLTKIYKRTGEEGPSSTLKKSLDEVSVDLSKLRAYTEFQFKQVVADTTSLKQTLNGVSAEVRTILTELNGSSAVKVASKAPCKFCASTFHSTTKCPKLPSVADRREYFIIQMQCPDCGEDYRHSSCPAMDGTAPLPPCSHCMAAGRTENVNHQDFLCIHEHPVEPSVDVRRAMGWMQERPIQRKRQQQHPPHIPKGSANIVPMGPRQDNKRRAFNKGGPTKHTSYPNTK